ncbi:MAG: hypothetical protein V7K66_09360 [Nostoc sp.]
MNPLRVACFSIEIWCANTLKNWSAMKRSLDGSSAIAILIFSNQLGTSFQSSPRL